jgi:hypothetical protein
MQTVTCGECSKLYEKHDHVAANMSPICYDCALTKLTGGWFEPQEWQKGHAKLRSGEVSESELGGIYFQQDALALEDGGKNRHLVYEAPEDGECGTLSHVDMEELYGYPDDYLLDDEEESNP